MMKLPVPAWLVVFSAVTILLSCGEKKQTEDTSPAEQPKPVSGFEADVEFLKKYTPIIVLENKSGKGKIAVSAALQGRVMTSTSDGNSGLSYGWINKPAFLSGDTSEHINVYGGEDRLWLGPEGGQFSIYFAKGKEFNLDNWYVPKLIDREPFDVASQTTNEAVFTKQGRLTNYSGTIFQVGINRKVKITEAPEAWQQLGIDSTDGISMVAYETINELTNTGKTAWKKETGLLSIWILGMFNPSPGTTILIPTDGLKNRLRDVVNDNYFGQIPDDRLKLSGKTIFFKADGKYRSKIGLTPDNAPSLLGSYDADNGVLTIVKYGKPPEAKDYVNSLWELQKQPYRGDAVNAYNDGPPSPGAKPLGPFYELESSSPAAALSPASSITHIHSTYHLKGTPDQLNVIMQTLFNTSATEIDAAF
jgi:hypothetical protein